MRIRSVMLATGGVLLAASLAMAQGPPPGFREGPPESPDDFAARMLNFDKDKDGTLTRSEINDERLNRLFDRADADKDGFVTKAELAALATRELANDRNGPPGFGPPPGGFGGPPGGGPGGFMGMPRPGEVLPPMLQQVLRLSPEQRDQVEALQKEVDSKLASILSEDQRKQLQQMRNRRPGGGRPPGGPGGPPPGGQPTR